MEKINYQPLAEHLKTLNKNEREIFAKKCKTTIGYMKKRMYLGMPFGYEISKEIAQLGVMPPEQLRPCDYQNYVWGSEKEQAHV